MTTEQQLTGSQQFVFQAALRLAEIELAAGGINLRKVDVHGMAHSWVKTVLAIQRAVVIDTTLEPAEPSDDDAKSEDLSGKRRSKKKRRITKLIL